MADTILANLPAFLADPAQRVYLYVIVLGLSMSLLCVALAIAGWLIQAWHIARGRAEYERLKRSSARRQFLSPADRLRVLSRRPPTIADAPALRHFEPETPPGRPPLWRRSITLPPAAAASRQDGGGQ